MKNGLMAQAKPAISIISKSVSTKTLKAQHDNHTGEQPMLDL